MTLLTCQAAYCGDSWRVNYDLYYVHDGVILEGHRHDWEGVTVVFKMDPSGADWWHRDVSNASKYKKVGNLITLVCDL